MTIESVAASAIVAVIVLWGARRIWKGVAPRPAGGAGGFSLRDEVLSRRMIPLSTDASDRLLCAVMDWHVGKAVATLVAFDDDTVSLYFSNGGGIIGGGGHASVRAAAEQFRTAVDRARADMSPASGSELPGPERVTFWAVTGKGNLTSGAVVVGGSSPFADAWKSAQETITQLRNLPQKS